MSETEEMAVIGRIGTDYAEAKKHLISLQDEAQNTNRRIVETENRITDLQSKLRDLGIL